MGLIIDSHVFKGYYIERVLEKKSELTYDPTIIFEDSGIASEIYFDNKEIIENEWRSLVDRYWFDVWFADMLTNNGINYIEPERSKDLAKKLFNLGFPIHSKDIWYIRTAKAVSNELGICVLITEDIDFYDPRKKKIQRKKRIDILLNCKGCVAKYLNKSENIRVCCVKNYCS